jgi:hypothetical protein
VSTDQVPTEKSQLLKQLTTLFLVGGIAGVIFGAIHLVSIITEGFTAIRLGDALINTLFGVIGLVCWRLLTVRNRIVIAVWGASIVVALIYAFAVGRGFNFVAVVLEVMVAGALVVLSRRGELS